MNARDLENIAVQVHGEVEVRFMLVDGITNPPLGIDHTKVDNEGVLLFIYMTKVPEDEPSETDHLSKVMDGQ